MATSRFRQTFKYPTDNDSDSNLSSHDEMDEQEQEDLISNLRTKELTSNAQYKLIFTVLPLAGLPLFLYYTYLFGFSTKSSTKSRSSLSVLWCLLAMTSLTATAYTMHFMPLPTSADGGILRGFMSQSRPKLNVSMTPKQRSRVLNFDGDDEGPIRQILPYLNYGICVLLSLAAWTNRGRELDGVSDGFWMFLLLPPVMLGMVTAARQSMAEVQHGIGQLEGMKYDYKGA